MVEEAQNDLYINLLSRGCGGPTTRTSAFPNFPVCSEHRLKEHKYALTSGHVWNSAVAEHAANTGHAIKWDGAEVIDSHPHLKQRCVQEAWHIQKQAHTINREHGQLPQAYHHLACAMNTVTHT